MNILLSTESTEVILGVVYWILLILGITILIKFFQIAKDVRSIKDTLEDIAESLDPDTGDNDEK